MNTKTHVKKGDRVMVIAGREKGKSGQVMRVMPEEGRVLVEKTNMVKRHTRPNQKGQGGIVEKEAPIAISNLMLVCTKCAEPTRVARKQLEDGKRVRACKKCGEQLDK